jgi:hypothetical protein
MRSILSALPARSTRLRGSIAAGCYSIARRAPAHWAWRGLWRGIGGIVRPCRCPRPLAAYSVCFAVGCGCVYSVASAPSAVSLPAVDPLPSAEPTPTADPVADVAPMVDSRYCCNADCSNRRRHKPGAKCRFAPATSPTPEPTPEANVEPTPSAEPEPEPAIEVCSESAIGPNVPDSPTHFNRKDLVVALKLLKHVIPTRNAAAGILGILGMRVVGNGLCQLSVSVLDGTTDTAAIQVPILGGVPDQKICVSHKQLSELLKSTNDKNIQIAFGDNVTFAAGSATAPLKTIEDERTIPDYSLDSSKLRKITQSLGDFAAKLKFSIHAARREPGQWCMNRIASFLPNSGENQITIACTDAHRLVVVGKLRNNDSYFMIPTGIAKQIIELSKHLPSDTQVSIETDLKRAVISCGRYTAYLELDSYNKFPPASDIIPKSFASTFSVKGCELLQAVKSQKPYWPAETNACWLEFDERVHATADGDGDKSPSVCQVTRRSGSAASAKFNAMFLIDFLAECGREEIEVCFGKRSDSPVVFKRKGEFSEYLELIMPIVS